MIGVTVGYLLDFVGFAFFGDSCIHGSPLRPAKGIVHIDDDLVELDGAVLCELELFLPDVELFAVDGVVEYDDAIVFQSSMYDSTLADAVIAAAVLALAGELVDESVGRGLHAAAIGTDGVALVDGELIDGGVVEDECLAFVGVSCEGAVADELYLFAETDVERTVIVDGIGAADKLVFGILRIEN